MTDEMQFIAIVLSDGRFGSFSGPVLCRLEDEAAGVRVASIKFHEPQPLPDGAKFEPIVKKVDGGK